VCYSSEQWIHRLQIGPTKHGLDSNLTLIYIRISSFMPALSCTRSIGSEKKAISYWLGLRSMSVFSRISEWVIRTPKANNPTYGSTRAMTEANKLSVCCVVYPEISICSIKLAINNHQVRLNLLAMAYQLWDSFFLSPQISEQCFSAWVFGKANRALRAYACFNLLTSNYYWELKRSSS
jgi:hypothetical protein